MKEKTRALKAAFPQTIPVFTGFTFLGIAYGILMDSKGYGVGWTVLMSLMAFAGSAQYVAITFLTSAFNPVYALLMTLMVNARHLFYGISMLDKYCHILPSDCWWYTVLKASALKVQSLGFPRRYLYFSSLCFIIGRAIHS